MPGTTQPLLTKANVVPPNATRYAGWPAVLVQFDTSSTDSRVIWPTTGSFANFCVVLDVAPGAGTSRTFTFRNLTQATSVVVTVSNTDTTNRDTGSTLAVTAGDLVQCEQGVTGAPAALGSCQLLSEFTGTTEKETGYTMHHVPGNGALAAASGTEYVAGPFCGTTFSTTTPPVAANVIAVDGAITALWGRCNTAPGSGKSWDFYLVKNGTLQDGTGGTVDTKCSVADTNTTAVATFSLTVAQGDTISVQLVPVNTPAAVRPGCGVTLTSTTAGESMVVGRLTTGPSNTVTNYGFPVYATGGWSTVEASNQEQAPINTFTLDQLRLLLQTAPGGGTSRQFTWRVNSATPAGSPSVTISGAATTGSDLVGSVTISDTALLAMQTIPSGTPASAGVVTWSLRARFGTLLTTAVSQPPDWALPRVGRRAQVGWTFTPVLTEAGGGGTPVMVELWRIPQARRFSQVGWTISQSLTDGAVAATLPFRMLETVRSTRPRTRLDWIGASLVEVLNPPPAPPNCEMPVPPDSGGGTGEP